jgi:hypothetical protein
MSGAPLMSARDVTSGLGEVSIDASAHRQRETVHLTLTVHIPGNTHIEAHEPPEPFLIPTVAEIYSLSDVSVEYPAPQVKDIGVPGTELLVYEGTLMISARGTTDHSVGEVTGCLRYQPCVGGACLPPRTAGFKASIEGPQDE